jgi:formylmethanofuran dehydrogenase subunit D
LKKYEGQVLEVLDSGECVIELPDEMIVELGWKLGDKLLVKEEDGKIILYKGN